MDDPESRNILIAEELQESDFKIACNEATKESSDNTGNNEYNEECLYSTLTGSNTSKTAGNNGLLHLSVQDVPDKPAETQEESLKYDQKQIDDIDSKVDHIENSSLKIKPREDTENTIDVYLPQSEMADKTSKKFNPENSSNIVEGKSDQARSATGTDTERNEGVSNGHVGKQMHTVQILADDLCTESEIVDISQKMEECNVVADSDVYNQAHDDTTQETDECDEPERVEVHGGDIKDTNTTLNQEYATMQGIDENDTFKSDHALPVIETNAEKGDQDHKEKHSGAVKNIDGGVNIQSEIVDLSLEGSVVDSDVVNNAHDLTAEVSTTCKKLEKFDVIERIVTEGTERTQNQEYVSTEQVENVAFKTLRVVLIGQTGVGKSETGNTLLGAKKFKSSPSSKSCTEVCQKECAVKGDVLLEVLDTPGLFDTHKPADELREEFLKCMIMTNPGPHAFLFILKMNRITEQEKKTIADLKDIFGGDQFLQHTIVVITRKEDLKPNDTDINLTEDQLFKANLENCPALYRMISLCGNRCFLISNKGKVDGSKRGRQADEILSLIKETTVKNGDSFYNYQYFMDLEEERKIKLKMEAEKREEEKRLEEERKEKEILAQIKEKELMLKLEMAEKEKERERIEAEREQARLQERLRQETEERRRMEETTRRVQHLEHEKRRQQYRRSELRREANMNRYRQSNQWSCNVM